ncbi:hypothetical protein JJB07_22280 [Tumebacillus sp. ITR2]|uniref:Uncharacterized protein n=1 Tax=Tumebacillus amylolyticus TaxID=2801339 RepID=A0ABS1JHS2_9BACL|nr:hypothetical protein [Tumebacillus amylolyticus]MBL0389323.1 hypothetical protein [Tumebacillus amylolyticus]
MRISWVYSLYLGLYTLLWLALTVIGYRTFLFDGGRGGTLEAGPYFFLTGLLWVVCCMVRSVRMRAGKNLYDPVSGSLALSGLLLILYANLA